MDLTDRSEASQKSYRSYMSEAREFIESELVRLLPVESQKLHAQIKYAILSPGKRLRPSLVVLSAESVGGERRDVINLAIAIELMHTASLVHDDILDKDLMRRNSPTVQAKWSVNDAILVGDALFSLALSLTADYGGEILRTLANAGTALCEGEYLDTAQFCPISEDVYLDRISKKCASLFKAAAQVGAMAGGGTRKEVESLAEFGECFGMAFQINDDLSDLNSTNLDSSSDLWQGRMTLPIIHLYHSSTECDKRQLLENLRLLAENAVDTKAAADDILNRINQEGSIKYCWAKIGHYVCRAVSSLAPLKSVHRLYLEQLAESLMAGGHLQSV